MRAVTQDARQWRVTLNLRRCVSPEIKSTHLLSRDGVVL